MRKLILGSLFVLAWLQPAVAQDLPQNVSPGVHPFQFAGSCQLTSLAAATALSACTTTKPDGTTVSGIPTLPIDGVAQPAVLAQITIEVSSVRYVTAGTNPTTAYGILAGVGSFQYSGGLSTIKFIQTAGGAVIDIEFFVR